MSDRDLLVRALEHACDYLDQLDSATVSPAAEVPQLCDRLRSSLGQAGVPDRQVLDDLVRDLSDGLMASTGGRFYGWVIGGCLPVAMAADWLATVWDQNAAAPACSPAMAATEEVCGERLLDILGLPSTASFGIVTGCQAAHITGLAAARHGLLRNQGWDVEKQGLGGAPAIRVVTGENRHESLIRAVRILGLGTDAIHVMRCDPAGNVSLSELEAALSNQPRQPTIVCLQAGDLNTGAFDPFGEAVPLAKRGGAWVHVDGAFGLWAAASDAYRHLLSGVEQADSWATDGHKWLNLPFDCGFVFVADPAAHSAALTQATSYSIPIDGARNPLDWNLEWSRRFRALPVYAALRSLGRGGIGEIVERCCGHAARLVSEIGALEGAEILASPVVNQGLVGFGTFPDDCDARTDSVIAKIQKQGTVWFGGTTWRGRRAMRVSVCNWRTTAADVDLAVEAVRRALEPD